MPTKYSNQAEIKKVADIVTKYSNQADIVKPFRATEGKLMKKTAKFRHEKINENFINNRTACSISITPGITFYLNDIIFEERGDL